MMESIRFDPVRLPPEAEALRREVRSFLAAEIAAGSFDPHGIAGNDGFDRAFSKKVSPVLSVLGEAVPLDQKGVMR